jgi:hypothetical protein
VRSLVLLVLVAITAGASACNDVRSFEGTWTGPRVGSAAPLDVGVQTAATATLAIDSVDKHGITGTISIDGLVTDASYTSIAGAEADVLSGMTFDGSPARVYLAFFAIPDGGGEALGVIALYDDKRVEARALRGGAQPLYAIFSLAQAEP